MEALCYLCFVFVMLSCLFIEPFGHLLGKGWPLGSLVWFFCYFPIWCPGSGMVFDCIGS